ncbi:T9SS type A sorting domain-containing protein [uncultured Psychroserpens sp.]|uniref:T9SS type A sorting domain-containing protein n=1 Tax=uncultured Psychroserpens sp. TaxID=255436 RepID=UPI002614FA6B|nr:T9SS type A sorting domain-containing protein [uncultured Psychroserpens sp.]
MKKSVQFLILIMLFTSALLGAQTTSIPDDNFEEYLETHAEDGSQVNLGDANSMGDGIANNNLVLTDRISNVVTLSVIDLEIADLTGIEDFTNLEILLCNDNRLATIDVSANTNLKLLNVSNNRLTGELVVSNNLDLEDLFCSSNQISTLNLSVNTVLKSLDVSNNALTNLDLSSINTVVCPDPQTDPITLCQGSALINVSRNQLTSLIVNNGFNDLVSLFDATDNPDLFCIQIDSGFTPSGWLKDDWTYYSENTCVDIYTYVPDDNFEQELINQGYDDVIDNLVLTDSIDDIINLDISNVSISSLIGIEDFSVLQILNCSNNTLESVDLSNNTALLDIDISDNNLSVLDVNANVLLTTLNCSNNAIENLDLSSNPSLATLNCSDNGLTSIDISSNTALSNMDCSMNQIESLDTTSNTALTTLLCNSNNLFALNINNGNNTAITSFDATNNANLFCINVDDVAFADGAAGWQKDAIAAYNLDCGTYIPDDNFEQALIDQNIDSDGILNNYVATADINTETVLNVSGLAIEDVTGIQDFTALQNLNISNNLITSLDLSNNTALQILDCSINQIEDLDLTANTALTSVLCNFNALKALNIENGNNGALTVFDATDNPNLFCINVDDAIEGSIPGSWLKDDFATYNGDCLNSRFTAIPDPFFEQALIDFGYDDVIDGQVLTSNIEHIEALNVSDQSISDLTGIRDFKSLVELDCSGNYLDDLDVSDMIYLQRLNCSSNFLLTNDINDANGVFNTTGTVSLVELFCAGNNLANLNTSQNINLEFLDCADNDLDVLDISGNTALRELNCSNNTLTSLDVSSNTALEDLNCNSNNITNLVTTTVNNTTLISLSCVNNELANISVDNYQSLETLNCASNDLTQIDVLSNPQLTFLAVTDNQISDINLQNNINLIEAQVSQNDLSQLDVSANIALEQLNCGFNEITQLDLSSNTLLEFLSCPNNQLTTIDLSGNGNLIEIDCSSNLLTNIILSNNLGTLKRLNVSSNQIEGDIDLTTMAISACVYNTNQTQFCPETVIINVSNNLFDFVNIQNGINPDIASLNASGNPNLTCIQVDDANTIGANWVKDSDTSYSEDCNFGETYVPDDNFEQALINLGYDSGPLNDYVLTANIEALTSLDINGNAIADLTGIEDFLALESLNCADNNLSEIDLSSNVNLLNIDCSNNTLSELNVENNTALTILNCAGNSISSLDLSANSNLSNLNISNNAFTSFLPAEVLSLEVFSCENNQITELDFQQNQLLLSINCQSNILETLNVKNGQNGILANLNATNNPDLMCIETDNGTVPAGATWSIDTTAQFATECFFGQTYVPDDNFEQALINLGYDSGALDDYVLTENIENITFLNVSGNEILDLTGIEDFVSLTTLDFGENLVATVDLSNNVLLVDLDASGNMLTDMDASMLSNLTDLDVSNNSITQLNFDTNLNLVDLNISNNLFTNLNVDILIDLVELNCAANQLTSLSITQNFNLTQLFCQSNMLIADQLNLQNGNNQNLQIFNATNNPDLGCILVDDPVAVISNTDGTYDNWVKDESASYQTICEDADNDGVPNEDDLCPNTEFGAAVDFNGCAYPDLPNDNFTVSITGETCLNSNNGKVTIIAQELYTYTVTLGNDDFFQAYNFTNDVDIFNLLAGTYDMCITIEEWPDYELCYTIVITEPDPLEVFANRTMSGDQLTLDLSGSSSYNIKFNGDTFTTHNNSITLDLLPGVNTLKVSTDLDCQGIYEERIVMTDNFLVYPNPFKNLVNIYNGIEGDNLSINIYSSLGQLVLSKTIENEGMKMSVNTTDLTAGVYIMVVKTETTISTYKIVKQ